VKRLPVLIEIKGTIAGERSSFSFYMDNRFVLKRFNSSTTKKNYSDYSKPVGYESFLLRRCIDSCGPNSGPDRLVFRHDFFYRGNLTHPDDGPASENVRTLLNQLLTNQSSRDSPPKIHNETRSPPKTIGSGVNAAHEEETPC